MPIENPHLDTMFAERLSAGDPAFTRRFLDPDPRNLTIFQQMALPVLRWFFFGQRASGRTHILAHVLIERAIETGEPVDVFDHEMRNNPRGADLMARVIERQMFQFPEYRMVYNRAQRSITVYRQMAPRRG